MPTVLTSSPDRPLTVTLIREEWTQVYAIYLAALTAEDGTPPPDERFFVIANALRAVSDEQAATALAAAYRQSMGTGGTQPSPTGLG